MRKKSILVLSKLVGSGCVELLKLSVIAKDLYRGAALGVVEAGIDAVKVECKLNTSNLAVQTVAPVSVVKVSVVPLLAPKVEKRTESPALKRKPVASTTLSLKKEVNASNVNPIITTDLKAKEVRMNVDRGINKWTFETPRRDLVELLAEQCTNNLSPALISQLFSVDHYKEKDYLAGLTHLDEFLVSPPLSVRIDQLAIANCDLILKYLTVRFFDTNTSILLKSLEVLEHLLGLLDESGYQLSDYEASSFIGFFIQKTGDPKETMRVKMRLILKQLARVYPVSKLFLFLLKGLDSKNSRTRTECLDEVAALLHRHGQTAFTPAKALPIIAAQVGDRDAAVRNASLGAVCQAYLLIGDEIYKHIGRIEEKDKAIIVERIRRLPAPSSELKTKAVVEAPIVKKTLNLTETTKQTLLTKPLVLANVTKQFRLDFEDNLAPIASILVEKRQPEPRKIEHIVPAILQNINTIESISVERLEILVESTLQKLQTCATVDLLDTLKAVEKVISHPDQMKGHVGLIVAALTQRAHIAFSELSLGASSELKICKIIVNVFIHIFTHVDSANSVAPVILEKCVHEILMRLVDPNFQKADLGGSIARSLNVLMVRVIENCEPNSIIRALLHILLQSSMSDDLIEVTTKTSSTKFTDLVMKCLWKITKLIPKLIESGKLIVEDLLLDINDFLNLAPPQYWKRKSIDTHNEQADMPLRTVKTILHEVVNKLGVEAMNYAGVLPNQHQSHVVNYLRQMVLSTERKKNNGQTPVATPRSSQPAADYEAQLDDIFVMISEKEFSKQGIQRLHDFQKAMPNAFLLVESRISQTGSYFQGYIRRGLSNLAQSETELGHRADDNSRRQTTEVREDAESYKETLAKLQRMFVGKEAKNVIFFVILD